MTAMLFTLPKQRVFDVNGDPLPGAKIYIYDTGTTTPKTVYTDRARTIAHTHPIVADADGYISPVYPPDGTYKIVVQNSASVTQWTADDQQGPLDLSSFSSSSSVSEAVSYKTTTYSATSSDYGKTFALDATGGTFTFTVPSAVSKNGQQFWLKNTGTANRVTIAQNGSELLDGGASLTLYPGESVRLISDGSQLLRVGEGVQFRPSVRQTVLSGPVNSSGSPDFLPATSVDLNLTSQSVTASVPLVVTAAAGFDRRGPLDRTGIATSNLTWSSLTPSSTCYLYVDIGADGVLTTGHTTLAPVYQNGGTYSTVSGQLTYNIVEATGKVGNGSTATTSYRVYVGEATTTGSAVGSTVEYAYMGRAITTSTLFAPGNRMTNAHNIGVLPVYVNEIWLKNITGEAGWVTNQYARPQGQGNAGYVSGTPMGLEDRNTASLMVSTQWAVFHRTTGVITGCTVANWSVVFWTERGW